MAVLLDPVFAALSDPTRRAVVEQLTRGRATVGDLARHHDMSLPSFLKHLKVLEQAGLVRSYKKGRTRTCLLDGAGLTEAQGWLAWQREVWEGRTDRLQALAETLERTENK